MTNKKELFEYTYLLLVIRAREARESACTVLAKPLVLVLAGANARTIREVLGLVGVFSLLGEATTVALRSHD